MVLKPQVIKSDDTSLGEDTQTYVIPGDDGEDLFFVDVGFRNYVVEWPSFLRIGEFLEISESTFEELVDREVEALFVDSNGQYTELNSSFDTVRELMSSTFSPELCFAFRIIQGPYEMGWHKGSDGKHNIEMSAENYDLSFFQDFFNYGNISDYEDIIVPGLSEDDVVDVQAFVSLSLRRARASYSYDSFEDSFESISGVRDDSPERHMGMTQ